MAPRRPSCGPAASLAARGALAPHRSRLLCSLFHRASRSINLAHPVLSIATIPQAEAAVGGLIEQAERVAADLAAATARELAKAAAPVVKAAAPAVEEATKAVAAAPKVRRAAWQAVLAW